MTCEIFFFAMGQLDSISEIRCLAFEVINTRLQPFFESVVKTLGLDWRVQSYGCRLFSLGSN